MAIWATRLDNEIQANVEDGDGDIDYSRSLANLPTELLVKILSYLSTSDKITMRYASRRFREASETPSLWKDFVWSDYEPRHLCGVNDVLKTYGEHVRKIFFPVQVTPTRILEMAHYCTKVTHLRLPEYTQLCLEHLEKVVHTMAHLKQLDVFATGTFIHLDLDGGYKSVEALIQNILIESIDNRKCIEGLLKLTATGVRELNLRVKSQHFEYVLANIGKWANKGNPLPSTINIFTDVCNVSGLFLGPNSNCFKLEIALYDDKRIPMSLHPPMPLKKLQFGPEISPFIRLSDHGIMGVKDNIVYLNEYDHYGTVRYTVTRCCTASNLYVTVNYTSRFHGVSYFDISDANVCSFHLEQLAVVCPNLQRLNLKNNVNCLEDLQGLRTIGHACQNLKGLNLAGISVLKVESCLLLWELLSSVMKLTHLAIDICMLKLRDLDNKQKLVKMFKGCHGLQALEINGNSKKDSNKNCTKCDGPTDFLFLQFPLLNLCRISYLPYPGHGCISNYCHQLKYLYAEYTNRKSLEFLLSTLCHLQQLYIQLFTFDLTDDLVKVLSAHGKLERVMLYINSITINGITTLINSSPNLILLHASVLTPIFTSEDHVIYGDHVCTYRVRKMFSYHKLFAVGSFYVQALTGSCKKAFDADHALRDTNLNSLWPSVGLHLK